MKISLFCKTLVMVFLFSNSKLFADTLIILNKSDSSASLVDLNTEKVVATVKTGDGPHEVTISPNGKTAVVSNYGDKIEGNTLTVIDIPSASVTSTIKVSGFSRPHGLQWISGTDEVLATAEEQESVLRVNIKSAKIMRVIPIQQKTPHMVAIAQKMKRAFVANIGSGSITVIDLNSSKKIKDIVSGQGTEGIDISPDEEQIWVTNRNDDTISVIETASMKVINHVKTEFFPIRVKFSRSGKRVFVTNAKSGTFSIFDAVSQSIIRTISFGISTKDTAGRMFGNEFSKSTVPIGIMVHPNDKVAFVAHANQDKISVIDLQAFQIIREISAGREPDGMGYSPLTVKTLSPANSHKPRTIVLPLRSK